MDDDPPDLGRLGAAIGYSSQADFADDVESDHVRAMEGLLNAIVISAPIWAIGLFLTIKWLG